MTASAYHSLKKTLTSKEFWLSNLKTLGLMLLVVLCISQYQQRNMSEGQAPSLAGIDYQQGPTLVYFWGSWCSICLTTSPFVSRLSQDSTYQVLSVALSSGTDTEISQYQADHDYRFDALNDDNGVISRQWGVEVTPSIFIINAQGEIQFVSTGMTSLWGMKLRLWLASL